MVEIDSYIQERPDSALIVLNAIDKTQLNTASLKAKYSLLYAMALDKNYIDTTDVSILQDAQVYYSHKGSNTDKMRMYYYLGIIYYNGQQHDKSIVCFEQAKKHALLTDDYVFIGKVFKMISEVYAASYNYQKEYEYICVAEKYFRLSGDEEMSVSALVDKARALMNISQEDAALQIYSELQKSENFYARINSILALAEIYEDHGQYKESLSYYNTAFKEINEISPGSNCIYAYDLIKNGEEEKGYRLLSDIEENYPQYRIVVLGYKTKLAEDGGDYETAFNLFKECVAVQDSIVNETLKNSIEQAQKEYFENQMTIYQVQSKNKTLNMLNLCLITLLLIGILSFVVFWQSRKMKMKTQDFLNTIDTLKVRLTRTDTELSDVKRKMREDYINIHQNQFAKIGVMAESVVQKKGDLNTELYRKIKGVMAEIISDDESHQRFESEVNNVFDKVMVHFREDFPRMSEKDYMFMSFVFAGFDPASIYVVLNYPSAQAVYTKKSRMKTMISKSNCPHKEQFLMLI